MPIFKFIIIIKDIDRFVNDNCGIGLDFSLLCDKMLNVIDGETC